MRIRAVVGVAALLGALGGSGCARPWQVARTTVESLQAASEPVAELLEDDDKAHAIITHVSAGLEAGAELIRVWENTESTPSGWQSWCTSILTSIAAVLDYIRSFGIDIPEFVDAALQALEFLIPIIAGYLGG
jgi:hypothetical protein